MLTKDKLEAMKPHEVFACGISENGPGEDQMNLTSVHRGRKLLWVAKRGEIHDWAIYAYWLWSYNRLDNDVPNPGPDLGGLASLFDVLKNGEKVSRQDNIQRVVPCDDSAYQLYRH